ncbi:helix-turn-helix domain-containing protein [Curtobacterium luteum]|uniref:helix-turn-helix domain-containing protein n=1 Tax=Curtobacterium luteum TaxID=33881 RepID=UPI0037FA3CB6
MEVDGSTRLIAKRLRAALHDAGLSVEEVAPRAGMGKSSLYRKLRGERHITFTELCMLSAVLGRHPSSFLRGHDERR